MTDARHLPAPTSRLRTALTVIALCWVDITVGSASGVFLVSAQDDCLNLDRVLSDVDSLVVSPLTAAERAGVVFELDSAGRVTIRVGESTRVLEGPCAEIAAAAPVVVASAVMALRSDVERFEAERAAAERAEEVEEQDLDSDSQVDARLDARAPRDLDESSLRIARPVFTTNAVSSGKPASYAEPDADESVRGLVRAGVWGLWGAERDPGALSNDVAGEIAVGLEFDFGELALAVWLDAAGPIVVRAFDAEALLVAFGARFATCVLALAPLIGCVGIDAKVLDAEGHGFNNARSAVSGVGAGRVELALRVELDGAPLHSLDLGLTGWFPVQAPAIVLTGFSGPVHRLGPAMIAWIELVFDFS